MKSIAEFYDNLAPDYDLMTNSEIRFSKEQEIFKRIIKQFSINSVIDAGCGTGFHSLVLARLGVQVTAVDLSGEMLAQVRKHASENNVVIQTVQSSFTDLPKRMTGTFDAVFCLGNTLAHIPKNEVAHILSIFKGFLKEDGMLIVQLLNYELILQSGKELSM